MDRTRPRKKSDCPWQNSKKTKTNRRLSLFPPTAPVHPITKALSTSLFYTFRVLGATCLTGDVIHCVVEELTHFWPANKFTWTFLIGMFIIITTMITMITTMMITMIIVISIPSPTWSSWPGEEQSAAHKSRLTVLLFSFRFQLPSKEDYINGPSVLLSVSTLNQKRNFVKCSSVLLFFKL